MPLVFLRRFASGQTRWQSETENKIIQSKGVMMADIINKEAYPLGYVLTTDSNCDLTGDMLKPYQIACVSMPYSIDGVEYRRDPDMDFDDKAFYEQMRQGKEVKTMACNVEDFKTFWRPYLEAGLDIVYLGFTHRLSSTYDNACAARDALKEEYPERRVYALDTLLISVPQGLHVLLCGRKYAQGASMDELIQYAEDNKQRIAVLVLVDSLDYLRRGGRLSATSAAVGTLLDIKPVIYLPPEGTLEVIAKFKGQKKAVRQIAQAVADNLDMREGEDGLLIVIDADADEQAERMIQALHDQGVTADITRLPIGPVIGAHIGPGTTAVCYLGKQRAPARLS